MPTIPSIRTSIENQDKLVLDKHARSGTFVKDKHGRPQCYTGGFSVVYPYVDTIGEKWAFRCWHADIGNTKERYLAIAEAIKNAGLGFLSELVYVERGINVDGDIYPTTRMRWIDGVNLKKYISQNKRSKATLSKLAENFLEMTRAMHVHMLAHGDLQHGNILVDEHGQLQLVDYDSFYCPPLKGKPDTVTGLPDYQHPSRSLNKSVSEKLDYFSELIIYLSILAIAESPSLADKYKVEEDNNKLLFGKDDFDDIEQSEIYKDIRALGGKVSDLLDVLSTYLKCKTIDELRPFEAYLIEKRVKLSSSATKVIRNRQKVTIEWDVPTEAKASLRKGRNSDYEKCANRGSLSMTLCETDIIELRVEKEGIPEIIKLVAIEAYDECEIEFTADKCFVYPTIPVKLSWQVKHAKKVWLGDEEVAAGGTRVIEPKKATTYILSAEDEFGKKNKQIDIEMLPVPQIRALMVPTPDINNTLSLTITQPKLSNVSVSFPNIAIGMIKTESVRVPSLEEMGLDVKLSVPLSQRKLRHYIGKPIRSAIQGIYQRISQLINQ